MALAPIAGVTQLLVLVCMYQDHVLSHSHVGVSSFVGDPSVAVLPVGFALKTNRGSLEKRQTMWFC